jgi:hypothetical protein
VECAEIVEQLLEDVCAEIEDEVRCRHDIQMLYVHMHVRLRMKRLRIKYAAGMISRCHIVICMWPGIYMLLICILTYMLICISRHVHANFYYLHISVYIYIIRVQVCCTYVCMCV